MNEAVFVPAIAMWVSMIALVVLGLAGGAILYVSEVIAGKKRSKH